MRWSWFDTARRLVDMDWYLYNTGRDIRLINGCGPTPESVRGSKGRNAQRRGFLSEDSCRSSERVSATTTTPHSALFNATTTHSLPILKKMLTSSKTTSPVCSHLMTEIHQFLYADQHPNRSYCFYSSNSYSNSQNFE